jgi:hypothetical protein
MYRHRATCTVKGAAPPTACEQPPATTTQNIGQQTNIAQQNIAQQTVVVNVTLAAPPEPRAWNPAEVPCITVEMLRETFLGNPRLRDYALGDLTDMISAEQAAPYVLEALQELVIRSHEADPASRNVYLNPSRADQVLVYDAQHWRARTLVEAIQTLFDGAARGVERTMQNQANVTALTLPRLPQYPKLNTAAQFLPQLYWQKHEDHIQNARPEMSAYLADLRGVIKEGHAPRRIEHAQAGAEWLAKRAQPRMIARWETPEEKAARLAKEPAAPLAPALAAQPQAQTLAAQVARQVLPLAHQALAQLQLTPQPARPPPALPPTRQPPAPPPALSLTPQQPWQRPPWHLDPQKPLSPRWTSCNAATALELDEPPPGESAKERLSRLAADVGISTRHWANTLWDAREEGLIVEALQEAAAALIEADQAS